MSKITKVLLFVLGFMMIAPFAVLYFGGDVVITWINTHEALWLFGILYYEAFVGTATLGILIIEFVYDKDIEEKKKTRKKKHNKDKVKIEIDHDGNASIVEAPKDLDVSINHLGKD